MLRPHPVAAHSTRKGLGKSAPRTSTVGVPTKRRQRTPAFA